MGAEWAIFSEDRRSIVTIKRAGSVRNVNSIRIRSVRAAYFLATRKTYVSFLTKENQVIGIWSDGAVFFPAAGNQNNGSQNNQGNNGNYWSSDINENNNNNAYNLYFNNNGNVNPDNNNNRNNGYSVRPVQHLQCPPHRALFQLLPNNFY